MAGGHVHRLTEARVGGYRDGRNWLWQRGPSIAVREELRLGAGVVAGREQLQERGADTKVKPPDFYKRTKQRGGGPRMLKVLPLYQALIGSLQLQVCYL